MAIERRLTELVGPGRRQAAHRALAQRPGGHRRRDVRARPQRSAPWSCSRELMQRAGRAGRAPPRLADARLHPPPARPAGVPLAPPARLVLEVQPRPASASTSALAAADELPLGAGALAGVNFDTDRDVRGAASWASAGVAENSIDAVSNRDFVLDYLVRGRHLRDAPVAARRRDRALVERGVRLLRGRRRLRLGLEHHAPEEEPRRRRAAAGEGAARGRRTWSALHGVLHGLPLTYNKDLQEDKEHLFDAVDTLELCARRWRAGCCGGTRVRPRAAGGGRRATSCWPRPTSPTCSCAAACPFREAHGIVAGLVRHALEHGQARCRS